MKKPILRKCIITNERLLKHELLRVVRTKEGQVHIHLDGRLDGRGAYLKKDRAVILKAQKLNALKHALECEINPEIYEELLTLVNE